MWKLATLCRRGDRSRGGSVSLMFAGMAIPLVIAAGLAVDYSFYVQAQSQLVTAADAAALHAVRVAAADFVNGQTAVQAQAAGTSAAQQWWQAQAGNITDANVPFANVTIPTVGYNNGVFTETITYQGTVNTHLAGYVTHTMSWPIQGSSSASISASSYSGFYFLIDNSSSMLIGATPGDIAKMEALTMCASTAAAQNAGQNMSNYSWTYGGNYSWSSSTSPPPVQSTPVGSCSPAFSGGASQCPYPPGLKNAAGGFVLDSAGFCPANTGIPSATITDPSTHKPANIPQAPCGFACHSDAGGNDYYTVITNANQNGANIKLRFDSVQTAAGSVMQTLIDTQAGTQIANQFTVGVYQFNSGVTQVHPEPGGAFVEADTNLAGAKTDIVNIQTPVVADGADTNFPGAIAYLKGNLTAAGNGATPTTRRKNLFIITDGLEDDTNNGRYVGTMTEDPPATETYCSQLKAMGYNIYVIYTPYYPLPNPFYLGAFPPSDPVAFVEPTVPPATTNPVVAALTACATSPNQFYQTGTGGTNSITVALNNAVQSALTSPGIITK